MSHYTLLKTQIEDVEVLIEALSDMGFDTVEYHETPQPLVGWLGDKREQAAEVIVRKRYVGASSNDIGFSRQSDSRYLAMISEFDRTQHNDAWLKKLSQRYAYRKARKTLSAQNFDLVEEMIDETGSIRMVVRRMA